MSVLETIGAMLTMAAVGVRPKSTPDDPAKKLEASVAHLDEERRRRVDDIKALAGLDSDLSRAFD